MRLYTIFSTREAAHLAGLPAHQLARRHSTRRFPAVLRGLGEMAAPRWSYDDVVALATLQLVQEDAAARSLPYASADGFRQLVVMLREGRHGDAAERRLVLFADGAPHKVASWGPLQLVDQRLPADRPVAKVWQLEELLRRARARVQERLPRVLARRRHVQVPRSRPAAA